MKKLLSAALGALLAITASSASAQVFTPTFQSPYQSNDVGLYISDVGDLGIEGILRRSMGSYDLGLRLGVADGVLLAGVDARNPLSLGTAPLDVALTFGGQGAFGDANVFGAQVGLSVGHAFTLPEFTFTPYIHPRAVALFGDDEGVDARADVGVDLTLRPNFIVRFGANLGKGANWGLGVALRR